MVYALTVAAVTRLVFTNLIIHPGFKLSTICIIKYPFLFFPFFPIIIRRGIRDLLSIRGG